MRRPGEIAADDWRRITHAGVGRGGILECRLMAATNTRRRRSAGAAKRTSPGESRSSGRRLGSRLPQNVGNIIGVILLVVAAFVAGYLIGRARPVVVAAGDLWASQGPVLGEDGLDAGRTSAD